MKKLLILPLVCFSFFSFAQEKQYDKNIMGCYKGSEQNQQISGLSKYWVSCRLEDGKSILLFVSINENGDVKQYTENGTWWTNNGKFYEYHSYSDLTDIYEYKVMDNGNIKFKSIKLLGNYDSSYEFIDYPINDD